MNNKDSLFYLGNNFSFKSMKWTLFNQHKFSMEVTAFKSNELVWETEKGVDV